MSWTGWQPLEQGAGYSGPAVYELRIVRGGEAIAVPRFLGTDAHGVLSIGQTGNMDSRCRQFIRAMAACTGHSEGNLLFYLLAYSPLKRMFPDHGLEYRFRREDDKSAAKAAEARLIKAYIRTFGEGPPLNCAIPDRYGDWECETSSDMSAARAGEPGAAGSGPKEGS